MKRLLPALLASLLSVSSLFAQEKIWFPVAASTKAPGYTPLRTALKQGFFAQQGLDVQLLVIGGSPQLFTALTTNQIAAVPLAPPLNFAAEELGYRPIGSYMEVFPNFQLTVVSAIRAWVEKNRRPMVRFLKAYVRATRWLLDNEDAGAEYMA